MNYGKLLKRIESAQQKLDEEQKQLASTLAVLREAETYERARPELRAYVTKTLNDCPTYRDAVLEALDTVEIKMEGKLDSVEGADYKPHGTRGGRGPRQSVRTAGESGSRYHTPEETDRHGMLYKAGLSCNNVAKLLGESFGIARGYIEKSGVRRNRKQAANTEPDVRKIAKALGLGIGAAKKLLAKKNIKC